MPTLQVIALNLAWLAGGIVIVEYLFGFPGIGSGLVDAVANRDMPVVQALCLLIAAVYVVLNLIADILTILVSPRLQDRSAMSTPEISVNDSELVEPPVVHAEQPPRRVAHHPARGLAHGPHQGRRGHLRASSSLIALLGPLVAPYSPTEFVAAPFSPPAIRQVWLGTDYIGHDVLSRVLCGGRTVIVLALAATVIGLVLGVGLGLIAGYARRWIDETIMRILDVVLAFPQIVLALLFVSILGPALWLIVLIVGISHAPRIARVARAATLEVAQRDFVKAAEALGVARRKILFFEILPNITSPLLVEFGLRLTYSIGIIAALSFLGFGLQPPAADWGLMINENRIGVTVQPWPVVGAGDPHRHPHHRHQPDRRRPGPRADRHRAGHGGGLMKSDDAPRATTTTRRARDRPRRSSDLRIVLDPSGIDIDDEVTLAIHQGEVLGLVGESASGKTTAGTSLLAYQRRGAKIAGGRVDDRRAPTSCRLGLRRAAPHPRRPDQLRAAGRLGGAEPGPAHRHAAHGDPRGARLRRLRRPSARRAWRR